MKKVVSLVLCALMLMSMMTFAGATGSLDGLTVEDLTTQASKAITTNLNLPNTFNESAITWASSNPNIIAADGTVTRPVEDTDVTLTASLTSDPSVTKAINLTVAGLATKVFVSENYSSGTSNWIGDSGDETVGVANTLDNATGNNYLKVDSISSDNSGATYTFDSTNQPSGDVVFKTRLSFDQFVDRNEDGRYLRFYASTNTGRNPAATIYFGCGSNAAIGFSDGANSEISSGKLSITNTYFDLTDTTTKGIGWFDLTVKFDFVNNQYTVTMETEGKTKFSNTYKLYETHNADSKLTKVYLQYREDDSETYVTSTTGIDDLVVTSSGIDGATAAERLAVYKSVVQNGFNSGADNRFVVDNINLASIPTFDGYTISWASNDESVLKVIDNVATIQGFKEIGRPVTLTATLTHDGETATVPFDLTVHPAGTTVKYNGTAKILDFENYIAGSTAWFTLGANDEVVYDSARQSKVLKSTGTITYGTSSSSGHIANALFTTASADLYIDKPADFKDGRFDVQVNGTGGGGASLAEIKYHYFIDEDGNVDEQSYTEITNGTVKEKIYSVPELGKWFNLKITLDYKKNTYTGVYDVYYDGERITETALQTVNNTNANYFNRIRIMDTVLSSEETVPTATTKMADNIYMTYSDDANWTAVHADLALANADVWSNLLTTGVNGSAITWTLESDDATLTDGDGVKIFAPEKGLGKGTAVLTATSGNQSRTYTLNFDLINHVVINSVTYANDATEFAAGVTIGSVNVSTEETAAKGYVAIFDGSRLDTIKTFDITEGENTDYTINLTVGSNLTNPKLKIFAWSDILKPLSNVFAK